MSQLPFTPEQHGFSFNNTWHLAEPDKKRYQHLLLVFSVMGWRVLASRKGWLNDRLRWGLAMLVQLAVILAYRQLNFYAFGLCGGMSFTELDYFRSGQPIPLRGLTSQPSKQHHTESRLRAYIWARTLDSLLLNTPRVLIWMGLGRFHPHRRQVLKEKTRVELDTLKNIIDSGSPWPICLIGTTWSPFLNHQVLAVGYEELANSITISVHDSNCPDRLSQISFDFTLPSLTTRETCPSKRRGPVQSIFCETYRFSQPPQI